MLLTMSFILFAGLCRRLKFSTKIDGYALRFHAIKTFDLSIYVRPSVRSACTHRCIMDPVCASVNIGPPTDEKFICELSDSDYMAHPEDLKKREGFLYIGTEVLILFLNRRYIFISFILSLKYTQQLPLLAYSSGSRGGSRTLEHSNSMGGDQGKKQKERKRKKKEGRTI